MANPKSSTAPFVTDSSRQWRGVGNKLNSLTTTGLVIIFLLPLQTADASASSAGNVQFTSNIASLGDDNTASSHIASDALNQACKKGVDLRTSQLCAQWKAADAAADSARWSWWQLVVGAGTLLAAFAAAIYARLAVAETRKIGVGQVRAYVTSLNPLIHINDNNELVVLIKYRNTGQSPANVIKISLESFPDKFDLFVKNSTILSFPGTVISQSEVFTEPFGEGAWKLSENLPVYPGGKNHVRVIGVIHYEDVFKNDHFEPLAYWVDAKIGSEPVEMYPIPWFVLDEEKAQQRVDGVV